MGLRPKHYSDIVEGRSQAKWFEVISENYMRPGGRPHFILEKIREKYPIALHGVSLSIGSIDPLNKNYLKELKQLINRYEPWIVSDHLCFTGVLGKNAHDLIPVPFTPESLKHIVERVSKVQDFLGRQIALENVSSYFEYSCSEFAEWEFLNQVAQKSGAGILLDINNIYVSSVNHGFDPLDFMFGISPKFVKQFHLAGHFEQEDEAGVKLLIDTHAEPLCKEVYGLYEKALGIFGAEIPAIIERDDKIPELKELEKELIKLEKIRQRFTGNMLPANRRPEAASKKGSGLDQRDCKNF